MVDYKAMPSQAGYRSISLFDIDPATPLDFRLAVYFKGRYITYRNPGQNLDVRMYNRFIYKRVCKLYVPEEDYEKFCAYLKQKNEAEERSFQDPSLSNEQRLGNRISYQVKKVTQNLFASESGQEFDNNVLNVINFASEVVQETATKPYVRIFEKLCGEPGSVIAHSTRVSILSTYLAHQLGFVNQMALEYIAAAGILHDIGKTQLNLSDDLDGMDAAESEVMKQHPEMSIKMLSPITFVPEDVTRIILEHHECNDGSGYPRGLKGTRMSGLSKVFVIANTFDNLMSSTPGTRQARAGVALQTIWQLMRKKFDSQVLPKAIKLLAETSIVKST